MPVFLSDPSPTLVLLLGALAIIAGAVAAIRRSRKAAIPFAVFLLLTLLLVICDKVAESPREAATKTMQSIATATQNKQPDAVVSHLADSFSYKGLRKTEVKKLLEDLNAFSGWSGAVLTDFDHADAEYLGADGIKIGFVSRPLNIPNPAYIYYTKATFRKQGNEWKLSAIEFRPDNKREGPEVDVTTFRVR